ncbi:helix-turn-helix transcriptional regulator [Segatella bryantii]|uniref:helix-turn-helix transcriptional regulator n=1 Tax=Segatella bryantii TaxID=77095 RepID=UPI00242F61FE|nr:WYL domain-containing protein [Segatella bryantii]
MSTNKNALLRYQILDRCFSDFKRKYEIQDLVDAVNEVLYDMYGSEVSVRQIRDDIKYMRDRITYNAPIEAVPYDGKKCYYRYEDKNFSIFNNELSTEEVTTLRSTIEMLARFRDGSRNAWLEEVISNLELRFGIKANRDKVVSFEQNDQLKGIEFLSDLIDAIINHQPLKMTYRPYKGDEQTMVIHPHYMKQYNTRWFLFGLEDHGEYGMSPVNKALDRIVKFSIANVRFVENDKIDYETYFDDIVGVTHDHKHPDVEHVVLKFAKERFPYVVSKPIHQSQQVVNAEDGTLSIDVRINRELEQNIFSFGQQVEVLSPEWFRNQIVEKYKEIVKIYSL